MHYTRARRSVYLKLSDSSHIIPQEHEYASTWDILRNYCDISTTTIDNMDDIIDHPSNGILLGMDPHTAFDDFDWCLLPDKEARRTSLKSFTQLF